jgi:hypothetical protein
VLVLQGGGALGACWDATEHELGQHSEAQEAPQQLSVVCARAQCAMMALMRLRWILR